MKISVVSIFPDMFAAVTGYGMTRLAIDRGILTLGLFNPRDFALDRNRTIDGRPYGGGPGMVMKPEPLSRCLDEAREKTPGPVVFMTPQGDLFNQSMAEDLARLDGFTLLAGRYEGVDERVVESRVDLEVSIGDVVLTGGEIPSMMVIDAISRLLPGVLGNSESAEQDSFSQGLLDYPHYTRPEIFEGRAVPGVLLSGNHEKIRLWRMEQSRARTRKRRPDLYAKEASAEETGDCPHH